MISFSIGDSNGLQLIQHKKQVFGFLCDLCDLCGETAFSGYQQICTCNMNRRFFMKTARIPMITKLWLAVLVMIAALLLLGQGFAGNLEYGVGSWEVPSGQPSQMQSQLDHDPKMIDPFFKSNR
jgi:hypothetical protein